MLHIHRVDCLGSPTGSSDAEDCIPGDHAGAAIVTGPEQLVLQNIAHSACGFTCRPGIDCSVKSAPLPPVGIEAGQMQSYFIRARDRFAASIAGHQQALAVRSALAEKLEMFGVQLTPERARTGHSRSMLRRFRRWRVAVI
jgi:hypothetical protein